MPDDKHPHHLDLDLDLDGDPRTDTQRAADAALGRSVANAAAELLAEGHAPRSVVSAFLSAALGASVRHLGREATVLLLTETADDVAHLPAGAGCAGSA